MELAFLFLLLLYLPRQAYLHVHSNDSYLSVLVSPEASIITVFLSLYSSLADETQLTLCCLYRCKEACWS